jgi:hypothetical protein
MKGARVPDKPGKSGGKRSDADFDESQIPPSLRGPLTDLRKHEALILTELNSDPDKAARFLTDPGAVLSEIGVPIDDNLRKALRSAFASASGQQNPLTPRAFSLPNGQQIAPNIKVTFVAHEGEDKKKKG